MINSPSGSTNPKDLTDDVVKSLWKAKREVIEATKESDTLLFIGNSAKYLYHTFSVSETPKRNVKFVPMSGGCYIGQGTIPKPKNLQKYCTQVIDPIWGNRPSRIVLVDHSLSGQSIDSYHRILMECAKIASIELTGVAFVNLVSENQAKTGPFPKPRTMPTIATIIVGKKDDMRDLANDKFLRLAPHYQHWKWEEDAKKLIQTLEEDEDVCKNIKKIKEGGKNRAKFMM